MEKEIPVSVIIPVYNTKIEYLDKCIYSVLKQTLKEMEILLMDDESEKKVAEQLDKYAEIDARIRVFHLPHGGVSVARNAGIENANGKYIMFIDADDWVDEKYLETYFNLAKRYDVDIVKGIPVIWKEGDKEVTFDSKCEKRVLETLEERRELQLQMFYPGYKGHSYTGPPWGKMYSRQFIDQNKIFFDKNLALGEDAIFNFRVYQKAKGILVTNYAGYVYRQNQESAMHRFDEKFIKKYENLFEKTKEILVEFKLIDKYKDAFDFFVVRCVAERYFPGYFFHSNNYFSRKEIRLELKKLCNNEFYHDIFSNCDVSKMTLKRRLIIFLLQQKFSNLLYFMYKINSGIKKSIPK